VLLIALGTASGMAASRADGLRQGIWASRLRACDDIRALPAGRGITPDMIDDGFDEVPTKVLSLRGGVVRSFEAVCRIGPPTTRGKWREHRLRCEQDGVRWTGRMRVISARKLRMIGEDMPFTGTFYFCR
jgi:hypothetical protein